VKAIVVKKDAFTDVVSLTGTIVSRFSVEIYPEISEKVKSINVEVGEQVSKGQPLVELEQEQWQINVDRAKAALNQAKALIDKLHKGPRQEEITSAEGRYESAKARLNALELDKPRIFKLYEQQAISNKDRDDFFARYDEAVGTLKSASAEFQNLQKGYRQEDIESAKAAFELQQALLKEAELNLSKTIINSPIDGSVIKRSVEVGELVNPAKPILAISNDQDLQMICFVPEEDVAKIKLGQKVNLSVKAFNEYFSGEVEVVNKALDPSTRSLLIKIKVLSGIDKLKAGMFATADIQVGVVSSALVLPRKAIQFQDNVPSIFIIKGNKANLIKIEIDKTYLDNVSIKKGISEKDIIIVSSGTDLADGDAVDFEIVDKLN